MEYGSNARLRNIRQVASGVVSGNRLKRVRSIEVLLSYLLHQLTDEEKAEHFQFAPSLTRQHMPNARLYPSREAMLDALPKGGRVAEVGTYRGAFAERIAAICSPDELHLIDINLGPLVADPVESALGNGRLVTHQGDSATVLETFPADHFDWTYIDADHRYGFVRRDLHTAHHTLRPGGFLMCNDYTTWDVGSGQPYGVARAVNEFIIAFDYEVTGLALERAGYQDILLRKPVS